MPDLDVTAWVTRTQLQMGNLNLNDKEKFILGKGLNPGGVSWRKQVIESPFYEGRFVVHEVKDAVELQVVVYALGSTNTALDLNISEVVSAFTDQHSYEFHVNVESRPYAWTCERADYEVGFATETLSALVVPVKFTTTRVPTQIAGPV